MVAHGACCRRRVQRRAEREEAPLNENPPAEGGAQQAAERAAARAAEALARVERRWARVVSQLFRLRQAQRLFGILGHRLQRIREPLRSALNKLD